MPEVSDRDSFSQLLRPVLLSQHAATPRAPFPRPPLAERVKHMERLSPPPEDDGSHIPPVAKRTYEKPVAWLLGRQLLNSFKGALLYSALGSKLDARDWMAAEVLDFAGDGGEGEFWFDYLSDTGDGVM